MTEEAQESYRSILGREVGYIIETREEVNEKDTVVYGQRQSTKETVARIIIQLIFQQDLNQQSIK